MSIIDVTQTSPTRLLFRNQQWCLEVVRWQAIERDLFNPIYGFVSEGPTLLAYLAELISDPNVLAQAEKIVAGQGNETITYDLVDGKWIQNKQIQSFSSLPQAVEASEKEEVRAHVHEMEERLGFLERQLAGRMPGNDATPSVIPIAHEETIRDTTG